MKIKFLPGLTTTPRSDWKAKLREIDELGLGEIALFPTWLNKIEERKELYNLLERSKVKRIPHIHVTDNVEEWEFDYYIKRFGASLFNIHINPTTRRLLEVTKYKNNIFIETTDDIDDFFIESLDHCGGLCLDISHVEDKGFYKYCVGYDKILDLIKKYKVGCAHVSAVKDKPEEYIHYITGKKTLCWSRHWLDDMKELDYIKKYVGYLPEYVSIELENSFKEQLEAKKYLEKIIKTN